MLRCKVFGHKINRRRVWDDGLNYRTRCDRCDAPLIRGRDGWRPLDFEKDLIVKRSSHPATGEPF